LVGYALDDDRALARDDAGRFLLLVYVSDEVVRRDVVEVMFLAQERVGFAHALLADGAGELADARAERERAPGAIAVPERHLPRYACRGGDEDAVARDLFRAPRRSAEQEHLSLAQLEDHLF